MADDDADPFGVANDRRREILEGDDVWIAVEQVPLVSGGGDCFAASTDLRVEKGDDGPLILIRWVLELIAGLGCSGDCCSSLAGIFS